MSILFDTVPTLDRKTDGQTDRVGKAILYSACIAC